MNKPTPLRVARAGFFGPRLVRMLFEHVNFISVGLPPPHPGLFLGTAGQEG